MFKGYGDALKDDEEALHVDRERDVLKCDWGVGVSGRWEELKNDGEVLKGDREALTGDREALKRNG